MKIALNKIKPSPNPIRTSWDEEKMEELARSIKEQGLIVPVKVRPVEDLPWCRHHGFLGHVECPVCEAQAVWIWGPSRLDDDGYSIGGWDSLYNTEDGEPLPPDRIPFELVYGHRRVEAARRVPKMIEIEAIVEGLEDTDTLIQALIENVQREALQPLDKARGLKRLVETTGWSLAEIERRGIFSDGYAVRLLGLLDEEEATQRLLAEEKITTYHAARVREAGLPRSHRTEVLRKASEEHLTADESRRVAESVAAAEDDAERDAILTTEYHDPAFHQLVRVKASVKRRQQRREKKERQENPREVKEYIEAVQTFSGAVQLAIKVAEFGKFSPEAGRFLVGWHDSIRQGLDKLEQIWKEHDSA